MRGFAWPMTERDWAHVMAHVYGLRHCVRHEVPTSAEEETVLEGHMEAVQNLLTAIKARQDAPPEA